MSAELKGGPTGVPKRSEGGPILTGPKGESLVETSPSGVPKLEMIPSKAGGKDVSFEITPGADGQPYSLIDGDLVEVTVTPSAFRENQKPIQIGTTEGGSGLKEMG